MEKNLRHTSPPRRRSHTRLTAFCVTLALAMLPLLSAAGMQGNGERVSLELKNVPIRALFDEIRKQTALSFVFQTDLARNLDRISVSANNETVEQVLGRVLQGTGLAYVLEGDVIVIRQAPAQSVQQPAKQIIKGRVVDPRHNPLAAVSISLKGTRVTALSGRDGAFQLETTAPGPYILVFSFVGMQTKEVGVAAPGRDLLVQLQDKVEDISDVVVTGYYTANKETYTGSTTRITSADLARVSSGNVLLTIQALDPAFRVMENLAQGSNPNSLPNIEVRGAGSLPGVRDEFQNNPNMPTFILDGFEVSAQKIFDMDPNRILSITLLKDAAATAIYGSRAANGVVVVESKVPEIGKLQLNYKGDFTFKTADLSGYDLLNAPEKLEYEVLAGIYPGADRVSDMEKNMDEYYQKVRLVAMGYNTDWLVQPINKVTLAQKHSLQVEQGTSDFRYNLSLFYDRDNGVMKESYRDRFGIGAYFQYRYRNLLFMNNLSYDRVVANNSPYGDYSEYAKANPYLPFRDINGNMVKYFEFVNTPNPLYNANLGIIDREAYDEIIDNFKFEWTITEGLKWKNSVAFARKNVADKLFLPADHTIFRSYYDSQIGEERDKAGTYRSQYGENFQLNLISLVSYYKALGGHLLTFNGGVELSMQEGETNIFQARGFPSSLLGYPSFATSYDMATTASGGMKPDGSESIARSVGYLGTLNYTWKSRYFMDLSGRIDGSSKFGADNRWAKLWSVGIGWNLHKEAFMEDSRVISLLRLRASTGFTGSQNYNPSQSLTMFDYIRNYYYQRFFAGAQLTAMGNSLLKWQRVQKNNIGLDIAFHKRFSATVDIYKEVSNDVLSPVTLPPSLGFSSYMENLGKVSNTGAELKLNVGIITRERERISWSVFGSAAHNRNKLLKISNALDAWNVEQDKINSSNPKVRFIEGQDMKAIWVVPSPGIDPATGKEVFLGRDGQFTTKWKAEDQVVGGTETPDLFGNLGTQVMYKQWQLNLFLLYSLGGDIYNQTLVNRVENADPHFNVDRRVLEGRWKKEGDVSRFKDISDLSVTKPTSRFVEKNNYLHLTSLNLSYEFDRRQIERLNLERLKLILYANDVFNWSSVKQERGLNYPFSRSFTLTVQVGF